jgi:hypothetical protein
VGWINLLVEQRASKLKATLMMLWTFRRVMRTLYAVILCLASLLTGCQKPQFYQPRFAPVSIQRKATHLILFENNHRVTGACTGTAVGPHAILTAEHCDDGAGASNTISLDLATHEYHIRERFKDGRDHIIYRLDGPAFEDISVIHERAAKEGEYVHYYGDPEGAYPPKLFTGIVKHSDDPSELTRKSGMRYYTLDSYPGCSGSAIYAVDGSIIGLITYGNSETAFDGLERIPGAIGFELNFSPKVLAKISK